MPCFTIHGEGVIFAFELPRARSDGFVRLLFYSLWKICLIFLFIQCDVIVIARAFISA